MEFPDGVWLAELAPLGDAVLVPGHYCQQRRHQGADGTADPRHAPRGASFADAACGARQLRASGRNLCRVGRRSSSNVPWRAHPGDQPRAATRYMANDVWRVPPLPTPDSDVMVAAEDVEKNPAVRLFVERAQAVQSRFTLTVESSHAVAAICIRLDGLPLAIELAAARAQVLTPRQILARLDDAFHLLIGGSRTAPTRQQTLRATLDWSYLLLDEAPRGVASSRWRYSRVDSIWKRRRASGRLTVTPDVDSLEMLTALVDRSLVTAQPQAGAMRYRLLEPVRQYAEARLVERGAWEPTRRRHAEYFLGLVRRVKRA